METAALWEPWKNQKAVFPPFPHRLENSPQKARVEFSTVPTASAAEFLSGKELGETRRNPTRSNHNWVPRSGLRVAPDAGWPSRQCVSRLAQGKFFLDFPFHRTLVWYNNITGPPPPSARVAGVTSLIFFSLTVAWAYWINRLRPAKERLNSHRRESA